MEALAGGRIRPRTRVADEDVGDGVLRKRKWNAAGEGGGNVEDHFEKAKNVKEVQPF
jgi:hypothetical protein